MSLMEKFELYHVNTCNAMLMPRSHIHGLDAGLATDTIRHHSWQSVSILHP